MKLKEEEKPGCVKHIRYSKFVNILLCAFQVKNILILKFEMQSIPPKIWDMNYYLVHLVNRKFHYKYEPVLSYFKN